MGFFTWVDDQHLAYRVMPIWLVVLEISVHFFWSKKQQTDRLREMLFLMKSLLTLFLYEGSSRLQSMRLLRVQIFIWTGKTIWVVWCLPALAVLCSHRVPVYFTSVRGRHHNSILFACQHEHHLNPPLSFAKLSPSPSPRNPSPPILNFHRSGYFHQQILCFRLLLLKHLEYDICVSYGFRSLIHQSQWFSIHGMALILGFFFFFYIRKAHLSFISSDGMPPPHGKKITDKNDFLGSSVRTRCSWLAKFAYSCWFLKHSAIKSARFLTRQALRGISWQSFVLLAVSFDVSGRISAIPLFAHKIICSGHYLCLFIDAGRTMATIGHQGIWNATAQLMWITQELTLRAITEDIMRVFLSSCRFSRRASFVPTA